MVNPTRGVLYPERLPQFHRFPAQGPVGELVVWFWIPVWDIEEGRSSRQEIVAYPALNLVVEGGRVSLSGASTRASHRDLQGRGWAVGALLRPAAVAALAEDPASLRDTEHLLHEPGLADIVAEAMASGESGPERAAAVLGDWLRERVGEVGDTGRHANAMADLLMTDASIRSPEQAAARLAVSTRTLQRMAHRYVGLAPAAMIRRRRLQEAAESIRRDPGTDLASLAAELGYADHAHLTTEFRTVLGFTPSAYRAEVAPR